MHVLVTLGVHILEALFVLGWVGSAIVLILTSAEDVRMLFEKNESTSEGAQE